MGDKAVKDTDLDIATLIAGLREGRMNRLTPSGRVVLDQPLTAGLMAIAADRLERQAAYGIIDPDYARVFTIARCIAWSEGYTLAMHGSFTRDLDLIAIPWTEMATDAEHLVKRIALALDDLSILVKKPDAASQASQKPHGRLAWTLTFKAFGDPRFVDLSVMPRATQEGSGRNRADANSNNEATP